MEWIDITILAICAVLLIVSFVLNFVASSRLSKLTATLNDIESKMDIGAQQHQHQTVQHSEKQNDSREIKSTGKETTYISPNDSSADSKVIRYRPPGSSAEGSGIYPNPRPAMSKSGIKIEAEPPKEAEPKPQVQHFPEEKPASPVTESVEEDDVMDVVTFEQQSDAPRTQSNDAEDEQLINPFIMKEQKIDFEAIEQTVKKVKKGGSLKLNMADVPMMIESERIAFKKVIIPAIESGIIVILLNADAELKTMLNQDVSGLTYA
ncbi:MAG: hypothetical protein JNL74_17320 [Fibrobacteres bacterium]|nr:hypothetical protein [Fibrobacterota bacterium]